MALQQPRADAGSVQQAPPPYPFRGSSGWLKGFLGFAGNPAVCGARTSIWCTPAGARRSLR